MGICLGNLSPSDIESRLGIKLSQEEMDFLSECRQEEVNGTALGDGKWHCFDIPFMIMCDTKETAITIRELFLRYTPFPKKVTFQIGW